MAKLGTKPNGIYYLDVQVPDGNGGLKRSRVGRQTRNSVEADKQLHEWKLGRTRSTSARAVVAAKGHIEVLTTSVKPKVRPTRMTMGKLFDHCWSNPEVWGKAKAQATIGSNIKLFNERIGGARRHRR